MFTLIFCVYFHWQMVANYNLNRLHPSILFSVSFNEGFFLALNIADFQDSFLALIILTMLLLWKLYLLSCNLIQSLCPKQIYILNPNFSSFSSTFLTSWLDIFSLLPRTILYSIKHDFPPKSAFSWLLLLFMEKC